MSGEIVCHRDGAIAQVRLRHPQRMNAMTRAMWRQLRQVFEQLQADPSLRVVVVRGESGHFCAGGDIAEYADFRFQRESLRAFHEDEVWAALAAMLSCDLPLVAQIEGNCMGAGVEIACCCDIRLAAADARFGAPIARREAALVARVAGESTARAMLLAAQLMDAPTLERRGFLQQVLPPAELGAEVDRLAQRMAQLAPQAARMNKATLRALAEQGQSALAGLVQTAYDYADSAEHREGVNAFMQKRTPQFS